MSAIPSCGAVSRGRTAKRRRAQKGSVLVEFALILPVFLLLLFGVVSFSVALYDKTVLTMATREGARAGVRYVAGRTTASIDTSAAIAARQVWRHNLISFGAGMPSPLFTYTIQNDILTVAASVDYTGLFIFSDLSISAQSSMKLE